MKKLSVQEISLVSGAASTAPQSAGFMDSIQGALVDGIIGAATGAVLGGTNGGTSASNSQWGIGLVGQGIGAIGGLVAGGLTGAVLGLNYGYTGSADLLSTFTNALSNGNLLPKA